MSKIYSSTNRIRFTDIPEKYGIPRAFKGKQCEVHSAVIVYAAAYFKNTKKYRQKIVDALNALTYYLIEDSLPEIHWDAADPLNTMPEIDQSEVEAVLGDLLLTDEAIEWDIVPTDNVEPKNLPKIKEALKKNPKPAAKPSRSNVKVKAETAIPKPEVLVTNRPPKETKAKAATTQPKNKMLTPKEDLYIQPPVCPTFDVNKVWLRQEDRGDQLVIYATLPEIPTKQNEISVSTDVNRMTEHELMNLYPNQIIRTRPPKFYERLPGLDYDEDLGVILPIEGFSFEEVKDNMIKYPHLFRIKRLDTVTNELVNFSAYIELDHIVYPINEGWDSLLDSEIIPRDPEFVKEYVIRRYLLERDAGVDHRSKMFGTLDPFLTLFMPPEKYIERGYTDTLQIVKQCVTSRVRYKQSRNPILRRLGVNV